LSEFPGQTWQDRWLASGFNEPGYSYEAIAKQLSYGNRGNAHRAVQTALSSTVREGADELRELALIELDEMAREGWAVLRREHILVSGGRVVKQDGQPVPDDGPVLAALDRLLKIAERRVRLLGLDAAVKSRVEVITADMIEAEITRLEAELQAKLAQDFHRRCSITRPREPAAVQAASRGPAPRPRRQPMGFTESTFLATLRCTRPGPRRYQSSATRAEHRPSGSIHAPCRLVAIV
jgi:hypothetical protein